MTSVPRIRRSYSAASLLLAAALLASLFPVGLPRVAAQEKAPAAPSENLSAEAGKRTDFRMEVLPVGGEAELLTIFGRLGSAHAEGAGKTSQAELPLVTILRDTLGDRDPENDRLRYVWTHSYVRPGALQRIASAVPFLYARVGGKGRTASDGPPPPVLDLSAAEGDVWNRVMWLALQNLLFNPYGVVVKSAASAFDRNARAYRQAHVVRALAILALYEAESGAAPAFTPTELQEIQSRLMLTDKFFGGIVDDAYLERYYRNQTFTWRDVRGHNWELLRQRAEEEGLYFEPLAMPGGETLHAMLWASRDDIMRRRGRKFSGRFLNVSSPWGDGDLARWRGHTETRYFDSENRPVSAEEPGARPVELIPLALYGLEHPKIPILLVDFRAGGNPKRREMSRRIIEDLARNVLALSKFGDLHYFLGRTVLDTVTGRRGIDFNQPTRMRAYSQLKLLLSLGSSLEPELRTEIERRVERVSINPLENETGDEMRLARAQYAALVRYATRADGLAAKIERDRRAELVPLEHGRTGRTLLRLANIFSLGLYRHREGGSDDAVRGRLDAGRKLAFHRRFLREVSKSTPLVEVAWDMERVRRSLRFVAEHGSAADAKTASAAARIFSRTEDPEARRLCLESLYRINNTTAKAELVRIYQTAGVPDELRTLTAEYLRKAIREEQRIKPEDARAIAAIGQ
jgi:hypothetical protein